MSSILEIVLVALLFGAKSEIELFQSPSNVCEALNTFVSTLSVLRLQQ